MYFIMAVILSPVLFLLVRIILIKNISLWVNVECDIVAFAIVKKSHTSLDETPEDAPINYVSVKYKYKANGKEFLSERISLDLVDRAYRPIEVTHDPFINKLRNNDGCNAFYLKRWPEFSVLTIKPEHTSTNVALLFVYLLVILSSYIIVVYG